MSVQMLVLNEHPPMFQLICALFEGEGYSVRAARYKDIVTDLSCNGNPDLIIIDYVKEVEGTFPSVVDTLLYSHQISAIPIVVYTTMPQLLEHLPQTLYKGNVTIINEPFALDNLVITVARPLRERLWLMHPTTDLTTQA